MWDLLVGAFALMLVIEGVLPFFSPGSWRRLFENVMKLSDGPLAVASLPYTLPLGLHGNFVGA